ncbi:MAG: acetolactate synthase [Candidatus Bathyarchaeota archaeon B24]|nr:MAG: acetolactate synthase [Candidatus Bathyarchaeota archaeon B24]RLI26722.1 MAG: acetolactate synthase small subunit [Candidatus Bathyarchaeota archaeon]
MAEHILAALVEHKPGVLYRVSNMFRRRNFNIESITVGVSEVKDLARMTITVRGDELTVEQVIKQLQKLVDVIKVSRLNPDRSVVRELALIKIHTSDSKAKGDVVNYANIFRGRIVDVSRDSMIVEITGSPDKIDAFVELMRSYGIKELARTGVVAMSRGLKSLKVEE